MKKFLLFLFIVLSFNSIAFAYDTPINVIYIHGSNQDNMGGVEGFLAWIDKMHPNLKKNFEKNDFIKTHLLSNAYIKEQPDMLYWGDKLSGNKSLVNYGLKKSEEKSNKIDLLIRGLIAQTVHDAVWIRKNKNMTPILDELNNKVNENYKNGEKTMLVGYSAGTFVTMRYLLFRTPIIKLGNLFEQFKGQSNITNKDIALAKKYIKQNTCTSAAIRTNLFYIDKDENLLLNSDQKARENAIKRIDKETTLTCSFEGAISGILNFGSPIVVFYSELSDTDGLNRYIFAKAIQNIVETNKFYLIVNYSKDPIAMPIPDFTFDKIVQDENCKDIKRGNGFIYDTMIKGGSAAIEGHRHYWHNAKNYTKEVVKAYENGYKFFYNNQ